MNSWKVFEPLLRLALLRGLELGRSVKAGCGGGVAGLRTAARPRAFAAWLTNLDLILCFSVAIEIRF
jgi:hypothetical protein